LHLLVYIFRLFACFLQLLTADSHIRRMPLDLTIQRERVRNPGLGKRQEKTDKRTSF